LKNIFSGELVLVVTIMALGVLAMSIVSPVLPLYLTSIDVSPEMIGFMFSIAMVGMMLGESSWGWVADKLGLKLPLVMGTAVSGLLVLCFTFTSTIPLIFLIFFVWGILRSALFGPGRGYIGTIAPPMRKATFMAIIAVMLSASRSIGALPSGFIADTLGYNAVFYTAFGIGLLGSILVFLGLKKSPRAAPVPPVKSSDSRQTLSERIAASIYRPLASQCFVAAFQYFGLGIFMAFLPLLATQVAGLSASEVGILFTIGGIAAVVLGIPMGMLADRIGKKVFMILGLLVSAGALAGTGYSTTFLSLTTFVVLRSLGMAMFSPAALGMLSESVPIHRQSTVMGVYGGFCENTGVIAGSAFGGLIWGIWGPQATFLAGTISGCLGVAVCLALVKINKRHDPNPDNQNTCCC